MANLARSPQLFGRICSSGLAKLQCFFESVGIVDTQVFGILILAAFGLMVVVTGGVAYLTLAEWRDRRRKDNDERANKPIKRRAKSRS